MTFPPRRSSRLVSQKSAMENRIDCCVSAHAAPNSNISKSPTTRPLPFLISKKSEGFRYVPPPSNARSHIPRSRTNATVQRGRDAAAASSKCETPRSPVPIFFHAEEVRHLQRSGRRKGCTSEFVGAATGPTGRPNCRNGHPSAEPRPPLRLDFECWQGLLGRVVESHSMANFPGSWALLQTTAEA
ncbi:uncharacterized protein K489DRAFT_45222 [Dissoconium aciculare CBS 342.82]|uniref:Uncharacterized protein n=1 Tax=Dissoconium aciculare CBS 342.82 TaxID=1314786 RepID=A0A6J3LW97_9PEZI|nr:uncharacterized protein K489DRAFT_45222 [Dissoconium aciculare CBS 342.82]KAF1820045.1 hypothetical protein K489DRAFT_45222 [Dissoconium aciculare CBS 342.82]